MHVVRGMSTHALKAGGAYQRCLEAGEVSEWKLPCVRCCPNLEHRAVATMGTDGECTPGPMGVHVCFLAAMACAPSRKNVYGPRHHTELITAPSPSFGGAQRRSSVATYTVFCA